jgi:hypothetical protein
MERRLQLQKKYIVRLTAEERTELEALVKKGKAEVVKPNETVPFQN